MRLKDFAGGSAPFGSGRFVTMNRFRTLKNNELLLTSDVSGTSFDGRYFDPMNLS
jgi:type IV secretory pathway protease TraF